MTFYAGLDAGSNGSIALLSEDRTVKTISLKRPESEVAEFLREYASQVKFAVVERQWMRLGDPPRVGVLIESYGFLQGLLWANNIPHDATITPQQWQLKLMRCTSGGDKAWLAKVARAWFPNVEITLGNCDAILISLYCAHIHGGLEIPLFPKHLNEPNASNVEVLREF